MMIETTVPTSNPIIRRMSWEDPERMETSMNLLHSHTMSSPRATLTIPTKIRISELSRMPFA